MNIKKILLSTILAIATISTSSMAIEPNRYHDDRYYSPPPSVSYNPITIDISEKKYYSPFKKWYKNGKTYIVGENGQSYGIRLSNPLSHDVLVVVSVDGINVISGEDANFKQKGYIVPANDSIYIDGWRKNLNSVAKFYFTTKSNSYAGLTNRDENVGTLGFAVFYPKQYIYQPLDNYTEKSVVSPSASGMKLDMQASREKKLGTGHGEVVHSEARKGHFERESNTPNHVTTIYYDSKKNLIKKGVIPIRNYYNDNEPTPFPGENDFVPDPPRYYYHR